MKIGLSKFTIAALAGFLAGIFLASFFRFDLSIILGITAGIIVGILIFRTQPIYLITFTATLSLALGIIYYSVWDWKENQKALTYNKQLTTYNIVIEQPEIKNGGQRLILSYCLNISHLFDINSVRTNDYNFSTSSKYKCSIGKLTKLQMEVGRYPEYKYGDILKINAVIQDPHAIEVKDGFSYGNFLLKKGIRGVVKAESVSKIGEGGNFIYKNIFLAGDKFKNTINKILPEPLAAFQNGLILGGSTGLPDSLAAQFNRTGTTHLVAVSGYNVTVIIVALFSVLIFISRRTAFWVLLFVILGFIILTGATASVLRAGFLAILVLLGKLEGRRINYLILILFAANVMLLFNPYALVNDVSFELSYLAFAGLIFLASPIANFKFLKFLPASLKQPLTETLAAQIAVLPIIIFNFGLVSIISPVVNVLVLPVVPLAMLGGFLSGIFGMVFLPLGNILSIFSFVILKYILIVIEIFGNLKIAAISFGKNEWWWIPAYYAAMIIFIWLSNKSKDKRNIGSLNF